MNREMFDSSTMPDLVPIANPTVSRTSDQGVQTMKGKTRMLRKRGLFWAGLFLATLLFEYVTVSNIGVVGPPLSRSHGEAYSLIPLRGLPLHLIGAASVVTMQPMRTVMIASHLHPGVCREIMRQVFIFRDSHWRYATAADDLVVALVNTIVWWALVLSGSIFVRRVTSLRTGRELR